MSDFYVKIGLFKIQDFFYLGYCRSNEITESRKKVNGLFFLKTWYQNPKNGKYSFPL